MAQHEITKHFSNKGSRNDVRMRVIDAFSTEKPGMGNGDNASRYIYYVETLRDGSRVFLKRPAYLHNGFDFVVCVENANYAAEGARRRNFPSHNDMCADLWLKKNDNPDEYTHLYKLLERIYECDDVDDSEMSKLHFSVGLPVDHILKTIKWLFIEQDIRYWNYSGRNMTWDIVPRP